MSNQDVVNQDMGDVNQYRVSNQARFFIKIWMTLINIGYQIKIGFSSRRRCQSKRCKAVSIKPFQSRCHMVSNHIRCQPRYGANQENGFSEEARANQDGVNGFQSSRANPDMVSNQDGANEDMVPNQDTVSNQETVSSKIWCQ